MEIGAAGHCTLLFKASLVEQPFHALTHRELAQIVLTLDAQLAALRSGQLTALLYRLDFFFPAHRAVPRSVLSNSECIIGGQ